MEQVTITEVSKLSDDLWCKHYKPLNLDQDYLWYTDKEYKDQLAKPDGIYHIWTAVVGDLGDGLEPIIMNGIHTVNRLGYIITENSWMEGDEILVIDD